MRGKTAAAILVVAHLTGCASASAIHTSQNEMLIQSSAAPACGGIGALKVAQKQAAIETVKAGYDRYVITNGAAANSVTATKGMGSYSTFGQFNGYGGYNATTTYMPGPMIVSGTHDQSLAIHMFHDGEPGASNAIEAKQILGPKWKEIVKDGVMTCTG
jgi:hypothetical protein